MPYGPGAKAEVLSILAFRAYPVNRGFATGRFEVTEKSRFTGLRPGGPIWWNLLQALRLE